MNDSEYCNIQINDSMLKAMYYELIKETRNSNKTISHKPNNFTLFILNSLSPTPLRYYIYINLRQYGTE